ncbi:MAG: alpha/beta hydrolase [Gammaproteobacteria bacterium]|nr:MAG: alpha/beta hydrolase [Gammaproteobacteria bacterium]
MSIPDRPPLWALFGEGLSGFEGLRLATQWQQLAGMPRGSGTVLLCPGWQAPEVSMLPLERFLKTRGYDARPWGIGRNDGDVPELIPRLADRAAEEAARSGAPVALVGWSLGGYLAREAARELPEVIRRVITLGSPVIGGPKYTRLAPFYRLQGEDLDAIEDAVAERARKPLAVPIHALYSRLDGVVSWQACVDHGEALAENVEVKTTHFGFGLSPAVFRIVADRLARDAQPLTS